MRRYVSTLAILTILSVACSTKPEAGVTCKANLDKVFKTGVVCTIEHRSGPKPLHVCWTYNVTCANSAKVSAKHCGDVAQHAKETAFLKQSEFGPSPDGCDQLASGTVTDLQLTEQ